MYFNYVNAAFNVIQMQISGALEVFFYRIFLIYINLHFGVFHTQFQLTLGEDIFI